MRLISLVTLLFVSYAYTYVRSDKLLDLDNYEPEELNVTLTNRQGFKEETFTPKEGPGFTSVLDSGNVVWSDPGESLTADKVTVLSVKAVPQLVKLDLSNNSSVYYKMESNKSVQVDSSRFNTLKNDLTQMAYDTSLVFAVNVAKNYSSRQLYTVEDQLNDGAQSKVFTPLAQDAKMTQVNDNDLVVFTVPFGSSMKTVTVTLKEGNPYLVKVDYEDNHNQNVVKYLNKSNFKWNNVTQQKYQELMNNVTPQDVTEHLTLDLENPDEDNYMVTKDLQSGLSKTTYSPKPTYVLTTVTTSGYPLWSSNVQRATSVLAVKYHTKLLLVKVTAKNREGYESDVNLENTNQGFQLVTDSAFTQKLANLEDGTQQPSEEETQVEEELDVLSPNNHFDVKYGTYKGVKMNLVVPKTNVNVKTVSYATHQLFSLQEPVTSVRVFLANERVKVVEVRTMGQNHEHVYGRKLLDDFTWVDLTSQDFEKFLKESVSDSNPNVAVDVDLSQPNENFVTEESSALFGVESNTLHAKDNFYFRHVNYNETTVNATETQGVKLVRVTAYLQNVNGNVLPKLVELEGYKNGQSHSFYYKREARNFKNVTFTAFMHEFNNMRQTEPQPMPTETEEELRPHVPTSLPSTFSEDESTPTPSPEEEEPQQLLSYSLDTDNTNSNFVHELSQSSNGYHFKSYTPKKGYVFGEVHGPSNFFFDGRGQLAATFAKFFFVHGNVVGARLDTMNTVYKHYLTYYYTYKNNTWNQSTNEKDLLNFLEDKLSYTRESQAQREHLKQVEQQYQKVRQKQEAAKAAQLEKQRKKELEEEFKERPKLSKKTRLYEEMVDFDKQLPPEQPQTVYPTEEEVEERKQKYATGEQFYVEPDLVYLDVFQPAKNKNVHVKLYNCMGTLVVDVTPLAGKTVHVLELHGKRLWLGTQERKCTNLQLFYQNNLAVGGVLRVTSKERNKLRTGDQYDYLFAKEGELQQVEYNDFYKLSLPMFEGKSLSTALKQPNP